MAERPGVITWQIVRVATAVLIVAAVIDQAVTTISTAKAEGRDLATTTANFFSFFTIASNCISVVALLVAVIWWWRARPRDTEPGRLALLLACASSYMLVTGIVYNLLLRDTGPAGFDWSNEVLHVIGPLVLLLDVFLAPRRRPMPWRTIGLVVIFPVAWCAYTLVRGPFVIDPDTGERWWYPYSFFNPHENTAGWPGVAAYIIGIAALMCAIAAGIVAASRMRRAAPPAEPAPPAES